MLYRGRVLLAFLSPCVTPIERYDDVQKMLLDTNVGSQAQQDIQEIIFPTSRIDNVIDGPPEEKLSTFAP